MAEHPLTHLQDDDIVLDNLPDSVVASLEVRKRFLNSLPPDANGLEFLVSDFQKWRPGENIKVAFLGGDTTLHREIAEATEVITNACNINLDFGFDDASQSYRSWSESDTEYQADIRLSFDKKGFWSLVGTDSVNSTIGSPLGTSGGRPHQRSLNLGGFTFNRPHNWRGVVRHEFLHALSFHHSHQNMRGPCAEAFRWEDDFGYQPTLDDRGGYINDTQGRRPGIYTYLAGFPNEWSEEKVNRNLRTLDEPGLIAGPFDSNSVMLYRFPALFYRTANSPCAPTGDGIELSDGDINGLRLLYGNRPEDLNAFDSRIRDLARAIESSYPEVQNESVSEGFAYSAIQRVTKILED